MSVTTDVDRGGRAVSTLGDRVRDLRQQMGWNQKETAERAELHPTHIGLIEKGVRTRIGPDTLEKLAGAFGVSMAYLLGEAGDKSMEGLEEYRNAVQAARSHGITPGDLQKLIETVASIQVKK